MRAPALVALLLIVGCSGSGDRSSDAGKTSEDGVGLKGVRVPSAECAVAWPDPDSMTVIVTGSVLSYTVCGSSPRPHGPGGVEQPLRGTVEQYTAAFARDDVRPHGSISCLDYADAIPNVIVRTTTGYWSLHVPLDACKHLHPAVKWLLTTSGSTEHAPPAGHPLRPKT